MARSLALMFGAWRDLGAGVTREAGGVGRISTGRAGPADAFGALPCRAPGEGPPLGPGLGANPGVRATAAVLVGLGFGTPARSAGGAETRAAGAGLALGATVARATAAAVGDALGTAGAGVGRVVARATGCGGLGDGRADGAVVGAGDGVAVGGALIATETGATVGMLSGAAGISLRGCVSKMFCVGCGFGCGVCSG